LSRALWRLSNIKYPPGKEAGPYAASPPAKARGRQNAALT
jgi:hypothetical protein